MTKAKGRDRGPSTVAQLKAQVARMQKRFRRMSDLVSRRRGEEPEECDGCDRDLVGGDRMTCLPYADGSPAGWFCDDCRNRFEHDRPFRGHSGLPKGKRKEDG